MSLTVSPTNMQSMSNIAYAWNTPVNQPQEVIDWCQLAVFEYHDVSTVFEMTVIEETRCSVLLHTTQQWKRSFFPGRDYWFGIYIYKQTRMDGSHYRNKSGAQRSHGYMHTYSIICTLAHSMYPVGSFGNRGCASCQFSGGLAPLNLTRNVWHG